MATRYSGSVTVRVEWNDRTSQYDATVSIPGEGTRRVHIRRAPADRGAVDSPKAYDKAAHAALSFTDSRDFPVGDNADFLDSGWAISRKPVRHGSYRSKKSGRMSDIADLVKYIERHNQSRPMYTDKRGTWIDVGGKKPLFVNLSTMTRPEVLAVARRFAGYRG